jgi:DNA-binding response OmpR family regulator
VNPTRTILLVDDDLVSRRQLLQELAKRGHRGHEAINGREAQVLIAQDPPDAVITELVLANGSGLELITHIRANVDLLRMPVVVYTSLRSPADRLKALHAGADDVLAKPANPEELILRVERALLRAETSGLRKALKAQRSSMMGDLEAFGTASLLTLIAQERRTGVLFLVRDRQEARLAVHAGRVLTAKVTGADGTSGAEAVYRVLAWTRGSFCLTPEPVDEADSINQPTSQLLMEGLRQQDETSRRPKGG